jgi:DNA-binding transcriptional LysR family regulator
MPKHGFDWALVRSFVAVLEAGSLMGAARKLGAQQPTLSRHLTELESQLGTPLFERTGRGVRPTQAALAIAEAAREMEAGAERLARSLEQRTNAVAGTVRIAASHVAATYLLPPILVALQAVEPSIAIEVAGSDRLSNLLRREADIAVRMVRPTQSTLVTRKLAEVPVVACAHRGYLKRAGVPCSPSDLAGHTLVGYDVDPTIVRGFAAVGVRITRAQFAIRTDDTIAYGRIVAAGGGVGFVAAYNLRHLPGVVPILPMLAIPPLPCWLAVHREIRGNRLVRRVFDFLAEAIPQELALASAASTPARRD